MPYPLEVHPEDVYKWQPADNDADCTYVGHDGWRWPDNTVFPTVTKSQSTSASWAANKLTISAYPGTTWSGSTDVASPSQANSSGTVGFGIRVTCPSAGLSLYTTPGVNFRNSYDNQFYGWCKSEASAPIGSGYSPSTDVPLTLNCPKPVASGAVDVVIDLWEIRKPDTCFGGPAEISNYQRLIVTIP